MIRRQLFRFLAGWGLALACLMVLAGPAFATALPGPLVTPDWLKAALGSDDLVIVDARGRKPDGEFEQAHIPGAVWTGYPGGWTGEGASPGSPATAEQLQALISGLGISNETSVVVVPGGKTSSEFGAAARIFWNFKYAGHDKVAILEGGWQAWIDDAGNPVETGTAAPRPPAEFVVNLRPELLATEQQVAQSLNSDTVLIDARPEEQYLGQSKSAAASKAGHIPGALNLAYSSFFEADSSRIKQSQALQGALPDAVADKDVPIIAYCNAGYWSAIDWFVLHEVLGFQNTALYADSIIGWTANPDNPVEQ